VNEVGDSAELLEALAQCRERMIEMEVMLRNSTRVSSVSSGVDVRRYSAGGTRIEFFVDAELPDGRGVSWWLELVCENGTYVVEGSVNQNVRDGQEVVDDLGTWHVKSVREATEKLISLSGQLVAHSLTTQLTGDG
jgi:hypothetical protein